MAGVILNAEPLTQKVSKIAVKSIVKNDTARLTAAVFLHAVSFHTENGVLNSVFIAVFYPIREIKTKYILRELIKNE